MKRLYFTLSLAVFAMLSAFGQITNLPIEFDSIRPLTEINADFQSDAYPWLSEDGRRIYYVVQSDSMPIALILHAERNSLLEAFSNPQPLSINSTEHTNLSPWLSGDELTIYFVTQQDSLNLSTSLFRATRSSIDEDFGAPTYVSLQGVNGFVSNPSLTSDEGTLYLYNSAGIDQHVLVLENMGDNEFMVTDTLQVPTDFVSVGGKLSPDGLSFYATLIFQNDKSQLYVYQRNSLDEEFTDLYFFENDQLNPTIFNNTQPAIGCNGSCIAFARATTNTWFGNDLWLAYSIVSESQHILEPAVGMNVFPNPATDFVNFEFEVPEKYTDQRLLIFNSNGQLIRESPVLDNENRLSLDVRNFGSGNYFYQLRSESLLLVAGKFLVE